MNEIERLAKEEQDRINEMKQVEQQQRHFESTEKNNKFLLSKSINLHTKGGCAYFDTSPNLFICEIS